MGFVEIGGEGVKYEVLWANVSDVSVVVDGSECQSQVSFCVFWGCFGRRVWLFVVYFR